MLDQRALDLPPQPLESDMHEVEVRPRPRSQPLVPTAEIVMTQVVDRRTAELPHDVPPRLHTDDAIYTQVDVKIRGVVRSAACPRAAEGDRFNLRQRRKQLDKLLDQPINFH